MLVPKIAAILTLAYMVNKSLEPPLKRQIESCAHKYCPTNVEIHVDRPLNTQLKDQSLGSGLAVPLKMPGVWDVYRKVTTDYHKEAFLSPGVRLVADNIS